MQVQMFPFWKQVWRGSTTQSTLLDYHISISFPRCGLVETWLYIQRLHIMWCMRWKTTLEYDFSCLLITFYVPCLLCPSRTNSTGSAGVRFTDFIKWLKRMEKMSVFTRPEMWKAATKPASTSSINSAFVLFLGQIIIGGKSANSIPLSLDVNKFTFFSFKLITLLCLRCTTVMPVSSTLNNLCMLWIDFSKLRPIDFKEFSHTIRVKSFYLTVRDTS